MPRTQGLTGSLLRRERPPKEVGPKQVGRKRPMEKRKTQKLFWARSRCQNALSDELHPNESYQLPPMRLKKHIKTKIVRRDEGTYSKSGSLSSKYVTKAQEYDFTITKNDTSFEGLVRSRNYEKALEKAQSIVSEMEEILFEDDGIGTTPESDDVIQPRADPRVPGSENRVIEWQASKMKELSDRIHELENISFKQKELIAKIDKVQKLT